MVGVTCQLSSAKPSHPQLRRFICGIPAWRCLTAGRLSKQAGESGAAAVIEAELRGVAVGELVVAAVLEEAPHRPDVPAVVAAELHAMVAALPGEACRALRTSCPRHASEWRRRCRRCRCSPARRTRVRPRRPGPPNPMPWIPSSPTMSLTPLFCEVRSMERREIASEAVFSLLLEKTWFQEMTACCDRLSKLAPKPGRFCRRGRHPAAGRETRSRCRASSAPKTVSLLEKLWSMRTVPWS